MAVGVWSWGGGGGGEKWLLVQGLFGAEGALGLLHPPQL